ncbi:CCA tRNA nucleotidyltransferase [Geminocystis sp.]|uniref:CCA tRNA nucleotidyltransferase n=1 Tax=Geminocystis sp. TaxID=2664100 RepID=UPI0035937BE7
MFLDKFIVDNLPFNLDLLPPHSYLVGGAVRDVLLQRFRNYLDLDFVLPHSVIEIAKNIANLYSAGFVILDAKRNIVRVVFPHATIDFAQQEGDTIEKDLTRRDFTINAIAYDCFQKKIIDPFNGQKDLKKRIIRMICSENLEDDPLRLLRGYRQACQLDFTIKSETRKTIIELSPLLNNVAKERINTELSYLLQDKKGSFWLKEMFKDGLLSTIFNNCQNYKVNYLEKIDFYYEYLKREFSYFNETNYQHLITAKLAYLTSENPIIAEKELINLKYSRQEIKAVITILKYTHCLLEKNFIHDLSLQYFFFLSVGNIFPNLAVFALADDISEDLIIMLLKRYFNNSDAVAHPQPLLSGNDLINFLKIPPSALIKQLLTEVQIAYIQGKINDKNEALQWIIDNKL